MSPESHRYRVPDQKENINRKFTKSFLGQSRRGIVSRKVLCAVRHRSFYFNWPHRSKMKYNCISFRYIFTSEGYGLS